MPSLDALEGLKKKGVNVSNGDNLRYNSLDTLASADDLDCLFGTLREFRDRKGNHPVITAMSLCANPDFEKIEQDGFAEYYFEPVTVTLDRYGRDGAWKMWREGESAGLFRPEFHGREHLNVKIWMDDLQDPCSPAREGFKWRCWGFDSVRLGISYQAAFDVDVKGAVQVQKEIMKSGLELFETLHGRKATFFVPPNGPIHREVVKVGVANSIQYVSTPKIQNEPLGDGRRRKSIKFIGSTGRCGEVYLTRNCFFEPSYRGDGFSIASCLDQISTAFCFRKPAIISTHRVNYVGGLVESNRRHGNQALRALIAEVLKRWPDVEFMSSVQLGRVIKNEFDDEEMAR